MKAALLAIALVLGFAAPAGPAGRDAAPLGARAAVSAPDAAPAGTGRDAAATPDGDLVLAVLEPERAMLADPRTGATSARELAGGTLCHGPLLAAGGRAVVFDLDRRSRLAARAVALDRRRPDKRLGPADAAIASARPDRLWLGRTLRADSRTQWIALREIDADGRVLRRAGGLIPRWAGLTAVMDDGSLVFTRGRGLVLRRPGEPRLLFAKGAWRIAADGERLAWCGRHCNRVRVWSAAGHQSFAPPAGLRPRPYPEARFSPDGSRLAVPLAGSRIAVIDLPTGAWRVIPGARTAGYKAMAWSPTGRWLYFSRNDRLYASRAGTQRPTQLPIRTGGEVMSIVSTPGSAAR